MPDYHPLDVRYKGPSTAYRGSARRMDRPDMQRRPTQPRKAVQTAEAPATNPTQNPWQKASAPSPDFSAEDIVRNVIENGDRGRPSGLGLVSTVFGGIFRTFKYLQIGVAILLFLAFSTLGWF
ncbi:MAG: hypothetical protein AAGF56_02995 [Pseudomonadota bacterium]